MRLGIYGLGLLIWVGQVYAFPCYVTVAKEGCWTPYQVDVQVIDEVKKTRIATVSIPKGEQYGRAQFDCSPKQELAFQATFQPAFWENERGAVYQGKKFIFLPQSVGAGEVAWNIPICFSSAFSKAPFPPDAAGNC